MFGKGVFIVRDLINLFTARDMFERLPCDQGDRSGLGQGVIRYYYAYQDLKKISIVSLDS
jgi:hypothetical protein